MTISSFGTSTQENYPMLIRSEVVQTQTKNDTFVDIFNKSYTKPSCISNFASFMSNYNNQISLLNISSLEKTSHPFFHIR